ncbi:IclR family transcriptional regulator [Herbiconiux sp. 11R-BC]|uniref:IclR family transcriptional regulator n=1 Tax=Herbiconiux sp. 11R-BC TaxID=3111637 RepID=UPI003BFD6D37
MQNAPLPAPPAYGVGALDRGLRLLQILRDDGSLRVSDAADHLGTSRSTAHRLLSTLVYRGFAVVDDDHLYLPGPSMEAGPAHLSRNRELRRICHPHLVLLSRRSGESANLMVRVGTKVRFLETVEAIAAGRTRDRQGVIMPVTVSSGGKAILAALDPAAVAQILAPETGADPARGERAVGELLSELAAIRSSGVAMNFGQTERDVAAVGTAISTPAGEPLGAVSVSVPTARFDVTLRDRLAPLLLDTRREIERDLAHADL